jgi:hypothetical protein
VPRLGADKTVLALLKWVYEGATESISLGVRTDSQGTYWHACIPSTFDLHVLDVQHLCALLRSFLHVLNPAAAL